MIAPYANIIPINEFLVGLVLGIFDFKTGYGFFLNDENEECEEINLGDLQDFMNKTYQYKNIIWYNR